MTILFAYDGSESADAAIAAAGQLLGDGDATADVVTGAARTRSDACGMSSGELHVTASSEPDVQRERG